MSVDAFIVRNDGEDPGSEEHWVWLVGSCEGTGEELEQGVQWTSACEVSALLLYSPGLLWSWDVSDGAGVNVVELGILPDHLRDVVRHGIRHADASVS